MASAGSCAGAAVLLWVMSKRVRRDTFLVGDEPCYRVWQCLALGDHAFAPSDGKQADNTDSS
eukprot:scaffold39468_cov21-Tisochrysis_lutea.AAC.1